MAWWDFMTQAVFAVRPSAFVCLHTCFVRPLLLESKNSPDALTTRINTGVSRQSLSGLSGLTASVLTNGGSSEADYSYGRSLT